MWELGWRLVWNVDLCFGFMFGGGEKGENEVEYNHVVRWMRLDGMMGNQSLWVLMLHNVGSNAARVSLFLYICVHVYI